MTSKCPSCEKEFKSLYVHLARSNCEYPEISQKQEEVITGLLMGDANINRDSGNPRLRCEMVTKEYLIYLDEEIFPKIGNGVSLKRTAKESAQQAKSRGFSENAKAKNYSNSYIWYTSRTPKLNRFAKWYSTGKKVWPEDIELTPVVLKHWYCGDGSSTRGSIEIGLGKEKDNLDKINSMFQRSGIPAPNNYNINENNDYDCDAQFTKEQSKELWEYMGEPLPGFEYKWPERFK